MARLSDEIQYLPGVGPKRAELLKSDIGVSTIGDLLHHFPYKHIDRSRIYNINELQSDVPYIQVKGKIVDYNTVGIGHHKRLTAQFTDGTGVMELVWFKGQKWIEQTYKPGVEYLIFGRPTVFKGRINIAHPEMEEISKSEQHFKSALQPQYFTSERMKDSFLTSRTIHKLIGAALKACFDQIEEDFPDYLLQKLNLMSLREAIFQIHFPGSHEQLRKAEYRLKLGELFAIQLALLRLKLIRERTQQGFTFTIVGNYLNTFYEKVLRQQLNIQLTQAQMRVIKEIRRDMGSGKQMNRLLQGDVGSGKTLVALMCMLIALDNGFQACLMAPTEILATQHFQNINRMVGNIGVSVRLLTGSTKKAERAVIHKELLDGSLQILIGTHALLENIVQFNNLGLVITDEQHRFGVAQRAKLWQKDKTLPHVLVMTATPIPRTLAMTLYGDLDNSVIDELPPGRKPIKTEHFLATKRQMVFERMRKQIDAGRQAYVVYPLIRESETLDYLALEQGYAHILKAFPPTTYSICMVHGQLKADEKEAAMKSFVSGKTQILVATTVIEVGVDVANATVMIIESAERFGLTQLHQLRGRVGRGADDSFCWLISSPKLSEDARQRINIMTETNDGFEIAEADLKMRGPGDIEGTQQSGMPIDLKIAHLGRDSQILQYARDLATEILSTDPLLEGPENYRLKQMLAKNRKDAVDWKTVS